MNYSSLVSVSISDRVRLGVFVFLGCTLPEAVAARPTAFVIEYFGYHHQLRVNLRVTVLACLKVRNVEWNERRGVRLVEEKRRA